MSRFNTRTTGRNTTVVAGPGFLTTESTPTGLTGEGAPGYARDQQSELFTLAVTQFYGYDTFYEKGAASVKRFVELSRAVAATDPAWMLGFIGWLRQEANIRTGALVAALEAAKAMIDAKIPGARSIVDAALQRADEPGEALSYWNKHYGHKIPWPVKRGIADAVTRLYSQYTLMKYDTPSHSMRFGRVIELVHPGATPAAAERLFPVTETAPGHVDPAETDEWLYHDARHRQKKINDWLITQPALHRYAILRRYDAKAEVPACLSLITGNQDLRDELQRNPNFRITPELLKNTGMTWEDILSLLGDKVNKAQLWEALIPVMGFGALLKNLRNFSAAGISDTAQAQVATRLMDPNQVARSRQLPMRFLSAYLANSGSTRWAHPLERALQHSLSNIPELPGRTLVLVDASGSMENQMSDKSGLQRVQVAGLFGTTLAVRNYGRLNLFQFNNSAHHVPVPPGADVLPLMHTFTASGGTMTCTSLRQTYDGHDRVIIITDEQSRDCDPGNVLPERTPLYTFNLSGYKFSSSRTGPTRHEFAGLTDHHFKLLPLLEQGHSATWPFPVDRTHGQWITPVEKTVRTAPMRQNSGQGPTDWNYLSMRD